MQTAQSIINLYALSLSMAQQPLLRKANVAWRLERPFNFQIINRAAVLARLLDDEDADEAKIDQIKIALASLRHFARCIDTCEIGYGEIKQALKLNTEVDVAKIKELVREQVKREHMRKPMRVDQIIARRTQLEQLKIEEAEARKRQNMALVYEVYFLCNASEVETFEHGVQEDAQAVDWDEYGYLVESLLERLVEPLSDMRKHVIAVHDNSCITETLRNAAKYRAQIEQIMQDAGIDIVKLEAEEEKLARKVEADLAQSDEHFANKTLDTEAVMALADEAMPETPVPEPEQTPRKLRRVSTKAASRIAEDTAAQQEAREHAAEEEVRKRQQKAKRMLQKAGSQVTSL